MNTMEPTPEQAQTALAEAGRRASQVHHADSQLRSLLLAILAADLVAAGLMSLSPHRGTTLAAVGIIGALVAALVFAVVVWLRMRVYSRTGIRIYFGTIVAFSLWNAVVTSVSIGARFWAPGQPIFHFGISEIVAAVPLVAGVWLLSRGKY